MRRGYRGACAKILARYTRDATGEILHVRCASVSIDIFTQWLVRSRRKGIKGECLSDEQRDFYSPGSDVDRASVNADISNVN